MKILRIALPNIPKYDSISAIFDFALQKIFYLAGALQFLPKDFFICKVLIFRRAVARQKINAKQMRKGFERNRNGFDSRQPILLVYYNVEA